MLGSRSKKPLLQSSKPVLTTPKIDLVPPSPHMRNDSPTSSPHPTTTNHSQPRSKTSPPKGLTKKSSTPNFKIKTRTFSPNLADYPKSSQYPSLTGLHSVYPKDFPLSTHLPSGIQSNPSTSTTHLFRKCMLLSFSTSLHSFSTTHDAKTTVTLTPPLIDPPSTSDYGKLKLGYGYHLLTTYFLRTLNSISSLHPNFPHGKPNALELHTNPFQGAGVSHSVPFTMTIVHPPRKRLSTKLHLNLSAPTSQPRSKPHSPPPLPKPSAPATNILSRKSLTEPLLIA